MRRFSFKIFKVIILAAISIILLTISFRTYFVKFNKDINFIRLDRRPDPNEALITQYISNEMPYLPIEDLINIANENRNLNYSCAWYPKLTNLHIRNNYWQEFNNTNISYYIFGAYLDNRITIVNDEPVVRILAMLDFIAEKPEGYPATYCQFWYKEQTQPIIMPTKSVRALWYYDWDHRPIHNYPHFLTCLLPKEHKDWIPRSVSLVASPCDQATNNVRVTYFPLQENEIKKEFAVCVKGLNYPNVDLSHRFVEYMETLGILGAEKITMYQLQVHANVTKVLKHYEEKGFLDLRPFSSSMKVGDLPEYRYMDMAKNGFAYVKHEVVSYNDCLYRNMYRYQYVAVIDIDEILMPLGNFSKWHDLMEYAETIRRDKCNKYASFCFRCIYFPRYPQKPRYTHEFPDYFYMLQHVERVREHIRPDWATKCLHNTDRVIATHNHFPLDWASNTCVGYSFNASDAQMNHYREPDIKKTLDDPVIDKSLWRFKDEIIQRSMKVYEELNFVD